MSKTTSPAPKPLATPSTPVPYPDITVTRSAKVWQNGSRSNVVMTIPKDVLELTGIKVGDGVLVTGYSDGTIRVAKADVIPGMTR
jgi:hypothetical protein